MNRYGTYLMLWLILNVAGWWLLIVGGDPGIALFCFIASILVVIADAEADKKARRQK